MMLGDTTTSTSTTTVNTQAPNPQPLVTAQAQYTNPPSGSGIPVWLGVTAGLAFLLLLQTRSHG
ncbi:MAG: hypothetical protein U0Q18_25295 [Bryobacteraceae bacterium]